MLKKVSAFLFVVEIIVLGVPVTFFALFGLQALFWTYARGSATNPDFAPGVLAAFLSCIGLFGFWGMSCLFLSGGGKAIRKSPIWLLIPTVVGVGMASLVFVLPSNGPYKAYGVIGAFGVPLLVPILHMAAGAMFDGD